DIESKVMSEYLRADQPIAFAEYIYEPNPEALLDNLLPRFTELQVYQALVEARASEESARMVAMRNATENAKELIGDLTLTYNKVRQDAITKEMLDIAGGAEALAKAS
ncbi:MAG: FoF1 ATP synthase subunit gamma, partial [Anaerolineae bacterium]|nr:FoF1 ATP synthase subunit gamma [Anaerolineae bacterium]